jgi:monoterpene epsilon-lactone hydrolase
MPIIPRSLSPQASAFMQQTFRPLIYPPVGDHATWRWFIDMANKYYLPGLKSMAEQVDKPIQVSQETIGSATVYRAYPTRLNSESSSVIFLHAGNMILLGGELVLYAAVLQTARLDQQVYAVDFRGPPDHPYPAALDDCMTTYRALLDRQATGRIAIMGDSGGANLAAAMCLRIQAEGLPLPASLVLRWPLLDLTESGDTFETARDYDPLISGGTPVTNAMYLAGHDPADPYVSPLFGDFARGFPPTMLLSGTRDTFLSNTVRMHRALRRAGIETALHIFEGMPHGGFGHSTPEDHEASDEARRFIADHWR